MNYPINKIRADFPILQRQVNGKQLIYFDNGATAHKPVSVIKAMEEVAYQYNSNIHRGVHTLSHLCTDAVEKSRKTVARFIGAKHDYDTLLHTKL